MDLQNRRVVITGASRGIGAAMADEFAAVGAELMLVARTQSALERVAERTAGSYIVADIAKAADRGRMFDEIAAAGPIDVWINNAGMGTHGRFVDHDPADITALLALNLEAPIQLCRSVLPEMLDRGSGHIVNVSSMAMAVTTPLFATYGASKAGLSSFAESLRVELAGSGVGLTTVEIGFTDTEMLDDLRTNDGFDDMYRTYDKVKLQRLVQPTEVATAVRVAVEEGRKFVRLPKRAAAMPSIVNLPRNVGNLVLRNRARSSTETNAATGSDRAS